MADVVEEEAGGGNAVATAAAALPRSRHRQKQAAAKVLGPLPFNVIVHPTQTGKFVQFRPVPKAAKLWRTLPQSIESAGHDILDDRPPPSPLFAVNPTIGKLGDDLVWVVKLERKAKKSAERAAARAFSKIRRIRTCREIIAVSRAGPACNGRFPGRSDLQK